MTPEQEDRSHRAILAACVAQSRCPLCGETTCDYAAAYYAEREPAPGEECPASYRGPVGMGRLAEMCGVGS